jgi:hypothetical protein
MKVERIILQKDVLLPYIGDLKPDILLIKDVEYLISEEMYENLCYKTWRNQFGGIQKEYKYFTFYKAPYFFPIYFLSFFCHFNLFIYNYSIML